MFTSKRGAYLGWLYIILFVCAVAAMLVVIVPSDAWPEDLMGKIVDKMENSNIRDNLVPGLKQECEHLGEIDCLNNLNKGCFPRYTKKTRSFLDCTTGPDNPTCSNFGKETICIYNPCRLECRWAEGSYEDGFTIEGRCLNNQGLSVMKRELENLGFKNVGFGKGKKIEKKETDGLVLYISEDEDLLIIDSSDYIYMRLKGQEAVALNKDGKIVLGLEDVAADAVARASEFYTNI